MFTQIKAKVVVNNIEELGEPKYAEQIQMNPVYGTGEENKSYSEATPSGSISLCITNKNAWGFFVDGKKYYVDFTPAG